MKRVKIGVIGCGAIGQVHHLPNLTELYEQYEVTAVCDVSAGAAEYVAKRFHVPVHVTDHRDLLETDVEAVLLCQSDPKTSIAIDVLNAGKHLFIEKPMCFSLQETDAIIAARQKAGVVGQVGYMKVFDPAFIQAKHEAQKMSEPIFVQINHLHPDNSHHLKQFHIERFDDIPADAFAPLQAARTAARREAIGDVPPHVERAFFLLSGSMIHDLYGLREIMGLPSAVVSTDIWRQGRAVTMTLEYPNGARCVASWVDLSNLWDFKETLEIYGDEKRVILSYPTGFSRGLLSSLVVQGIDEEGTTYRSEPALDWESAFIAELRHFHDCIINGTECRTPVEAARHDISLIIDIIKRYQETH